MTLILYMTGQSANDQILLCVFGAKQACVVSINITKNQVKGGSTITFTSPVLRTKDWIWDAHWVSEKVHILPLFRREKCFIYKGPDYLLYWNDKIK